MTITQTIFECLKAAATGIAAVSLYFAYRQLRANVRWNRINATYSFLPETIYLERERALATALEPLKIDLYERQDPLSAEIVKAIMADSKVFREVKDFLNMFEDYSAAYRAKAIDQNHAYLLNATRYIHHFRVFEPFIKALRTQRENPMYYWQYEWLVKNVWMDRQNKQIKVVKKAQDDANPNSTYP